MMRRIRPFLLIVLAMLTGCYKSPGERVHDASNGGALGRFGTVPTFVVFSDELKTGGGAFEYPGGENQALAFNDQSNPISRRSIRYSWNGQPAKVGSAEHVFAGFDLMHTIDQASYAATSGRDMRHAGYAKITFYARGELSTNTVLKIEAADDGIESTSAPCITLSANGSDDTLVNPCGTTGTLSAGWQSYTISIPNPVLISVKDFFKATFVFSDPYVGAPPGQGGVVYFDQIEYQP